MRPYRSRTPRTSPHASRVRPSWSSTLPATCSGSARVERKPPQPSRSSSPSEPCQFSGGLSAGGENSANPLRRAPPAGILTTSPGHDRAAMNSQKNHGTITSARYRSVIYSSVHRLFAVAVGAECDCRTLLVQGRGSVASLCDRPSPMSAAGSLFLGESGDSVGRRCRGEPEWPNARSRSPHGNRSFARR
jgi:hypothetical protein